MGAEVYRREMKGRTLSDSERERRRREIQKEALEMIAARGQFNFRLDGKDIKRLYKFASARQRPVSVMVREWVLDRLAIEEKDGYVDPPWLQKLEQRLTRTESLRAVSIEKRLEVVEKKILKRRA